MVGRPQIATTIDERVVERATPDTARASERSTGSEVETVP
jgi:hypothetical protein